MEQSMVKAYRDGPGSAGHLLRQLSIGYSNHSVRLRGRTSSWTEREMDIYKKLRAVSAHLNLDNLWLFCWFHIMILFLFFLVLLLNFHRSFVEPFLEHVFIQSYSHIYTEVGSIIQVLGPPATLLIWQVMSRRVPPDGPAHGEVCPGCRGSWSRSSCEHEDPSGSHQGCRHMWGTFSWPHPGGLGSSGWFLCSSRQLWEEGH